MPLQRNRKEKEYRLYHEYYSDSTGLAWNLTDRRCGALHGKIIISAMGLGFA